MGRGRFISQAPNAPRPPQGGQRLARVWFIATMVASVMGGTTWAAAQQEPAEVDEETRTVVRRMAEDGAAQYDAGEYEKARDLFHRANAAYPAPTLVLWEARSLVKLGRLVEAEEKYATVERYPLRVDDPEAFRVAVREAREETENLRRRIPTLTITVGGEEAKDPSAEVRIDDRVVNPALLGYPNPIDPGDHKVSLWVSGEEVAHVTVSVDEREQVPIELRSSPPEPLAPPPAPEPLAPPPLATTPPPATPRDRHLGVRRTLGWIGLGVGIAGVGTGTVAGVIATRKHSVLKEHCPNDECPPEYHDDLNAFRSLRTVSTVGYTVGLIGVAGGVGLLLSAHPRRQATAVTLELRPTGAVLRGSF